jgi:hypothetical protein
MNSHLLLYYFLPKQALNENSKCAFHGYTIKTPELKVCFLLSVKVRNVSISSTSAAGNITGDIYVGNVLVSNNEKFL